MIVNVLDGMSREPLIKLDGSNAACSAVRGDNVRDLAAQSEPGLSRIETVKIVTDCSWRDMRAGF